MTKLPQEPEMPRNGSASIVVSSQSQFDSLMQVVEPGAVLKMSGKFGPLVIPSRVTRLSIVPDGDRWQCVSAPGRASFTVDLGVTDLSVRGMNATRGEYPEKAMSLVQMGYTADGSREARTVEELANRILFDDCIITGLPHANTRIGILGNARNLTIENCEIDHIREANEESQGVLLTNTDGRVKLENNHITAAGIGVLCGGSVSTIPGLRLADVSVLRCVITKRDEWRQPAGTPGRIVIKNHVEFKKGERVLVRGCELLNNWGGQGQDGTAFLVTLRDKSPLIDNVTFEDNVIDGTVHGCLIASRDSKSPDLTEQYVGSVRLSGNVWRNVSHYVYQIGGTFADSPVASVSISDDRWSHAGLPVSSGVMHLFGFKPAVKSLEMLDCVGTEGNYGIFSDSDVGVAPYAVESQFSNVTFFAGKDRKRKYPSGVSVFVCNENS